VESLNWTDWMILAIILCSAGLGALVGFIFSVVHLLGWFFGLMVAFQGYALVADIVLQWIPLPTTLADILSFLLLFLSVYGLILMVGSLASLLNRFRVVKILDRIGGGMIGLTAGLVVSGALLLLLSSFPLVPGWGEEVEGGLLAPEFQETTDHWYQRLGGHIPMEFPDMAFYPEETLPVYPEEGPDVSESSSIDFEALDSSTCIACEGEVEFLGYQTNRYENQSPKFACQDCGRTSDGCQTFEGHHQMYQRCPEELGRQGYRTDCGIWSNENFIRPTKPCPVCAD